MAKSLNAKKTAKKEPLKTAKEKKEEKRDKKNSPKRDQTSIQLSVYSVQQFTEHYTTEKLIISQEYLLKFLRRISRIFEKN